MPVTEHRFLLYIYDTVFITSVGFGAFVFLLPIFAEKLGASYIELGLIGSVGSVVYTVMTILAGYLADRFNSIHIYLIGLILTIISVGLFSAVRIVQDIVVLRAFLGMGAAMFWALPIALVADVSAPETRAKAVGRYNMAWGAGFLLGPFMGGVISEILGFRTLFILLSGLMVVSAVIVFRGVAPRYPSLRSRESVSSGFDLSTLRNLLPVYFITIPYGIITSVVMSILPGYMSDIGIAASLIGVLFAGYNGMRVFTFMYSDKFVRLGEKSSLNIAAVILSLSLLAIALCTHPLAFAIPLILIGVSAGIVSPLIQNAIARRIPKERLGIAMGAYESMFGVGSSIGPVLAGGLAELFQPNVPYMFLTVLALTMLPLASRFQRSAL